MTAPGPLRKESPPRSVRLKAKWGSPRITNAFVRQRLFQTLDGMTARQCTWLVAPGGYGKTYLLQSYLKSGRRSAIWYNLDEGDSDIATFFDDFSEALETAGHGPLLRLSPDVQHLARFRCRHGQCDSRRPRFHAIQHHLRNTPGPDCPGGLLEQGLPRDFR